MTKFPVIMFHRVEDSLYMHKQGLNLSGEEVSETKFRYTMERLKQNYDVLPLPEVASAIREGKSLPEHAAVLTFDDGTKDTMKVALPILEEYGFPATCFVIGDTLLGKIPPTFALQLITGNPDKLRDVNDVFVPDALRKHSPRLYDQFMNGIEVPKERYIGESDGRTRQIKFMINYLMDAKEKENVSKYVLDRMFPGVDETKIVDMMFLTPEEVASLEGRLNIGSHLMSHMGLHALDKVDAVDEIENSRFLLGKLMGKPITSVGYPGAGTLEGLDDSVVEAIGECYTCGCMLTDQKTLADTEENPFQINRIHERFFYDNDFS